MPLRNILQKQIVGSFAVIATFGVALLAPGAAQAQTMYSIGEDLWRYDLSGSGTTGTATATKIRDFASTFWSVRSNGTAGAGNALAFDNVHNQLLFSDGQAKTLYYYNLTTSTFGTLGTFAVTGVDLTDYNLAGHASFYNGKYYLTTELTSASLATANTKPWNFMTEITLNSAGTGISSTAIIGGTSDSPMKNWGSNVSNGFGDGGDMAIDKNGKIYGFSSAVASNPTGTNSIAGYWTANITNPAGGVTVIDSTISGGQAAYQNGVLYRNNGTTSIESRNLTTGAVTNTYTLSGFSDAQNIADMAAAVESPEPGSIVLMVSAGAAPLGGFLLRRRRAARKSARAAA